MAQSPQANTGLASVGEVGLTGHFDFGSSATSAATGGQIKMGSISNSSGGTIGLVKLLALGGFALLAWRFLSKR